MDLKQKIARLRTKEDLVLYKWSCGRSRIADSFIPLSNLRLNSLTCSGGRVFFSSAAPVLYMDKGRSVIRFFDKDVLTVIEGERKGINILGSFLHDREKAVSASFCSNREIDGDNQPKWIEQKILSLGCSMAFPVSGLIMPELFRLSRSVDSIKPLFTTDMLRAIGANRSDNIDKLIGLFREHFELFGESTPVGYIIPNEYVASGGICVASSRGIGLRSGSCTHSIPLTMFKRIVECKKWIVNTGDTTNGVERLAESDRTGKED